MNVNSMLKTLKITKGILFLTWMPIAGGLVIYKGNILYFFVSFFFVWLATYIIIPFFEDKLGASPVEPDFSKEGTRISD